jgi:hypothetical protein
LYTAGLVLGNSKWRSFGWRWLNHALQNQIGEDGEYIQGSVNYHRLMLQTALWVNTIRNADFSPQNQWPPATARALSRAARRLFSLLDPVSGQTPNLGSNDGSLIFPLHDCSFSDYRPVVQAAGRAFLGARISPGLWDEPSDWLGLTPAAGTSMPDHDPADTLHGKHSWAYLRAARLRSRLTHMDQLHLDLWWRGLNVALDAGAYLYNGRPPWDNPLTATGYNTVSIAARSDGRAAAS